METKFISYILALDDRVTEIGSKMFRVTLRGGQKVIKRRFSNYLLIQKKINFKKMTKLNVNRFSQLGKQLISMFEDVNEDNNLKFRIKNLSKSIECLEEYNEFDWNESFIDFYLNIIQSDNYVGISSEIRKLVMILACVETLHETGIITIHLMNCIEELTQDDLQVIADILGSTITYSDISIVNNDYLARCPSIKPSK